MSASGRPVGGTHRVPGDKSISHRALMVAGLAPGRSELRGLLTSLDIAASAGVLRAVGAEVSELSPDTPVSVTGASQWRPPQVPLQCGNSGTTARLLLGLLAGHPITARLEGDASLQRRPMARVTEPLRQMGARFDGAADHLPLQIRGGPLSPIRWVSPVASAQIKSALLFAGVTGRVPVWVDAPGASRDHTERMLRGFGYRVTSQDNVVAFEPTGEVRPFDLDIPGDPSSAAFLAAAALLAQEGEIRLAGVGCNPGRIGFVDVMRRMGGKVSIEGVVDSHGEPVGELIVSPSSLAAVDVAAMEVPSLIDEIPILACLAARAQGTSRFHGLAELRHKESDRLNLMARNLRDVGIEASVSGDDLLVRGSDRVLRGSVVTEGDHRIAMAFSVLATTPGSQIEIDDPACADVSFPGFAESLAALSVAER